MTARPADAVRAALRRLIDQYGADLVRDRARLAGLLRDECGQHRREINLLLDALDERVVDRLRSPSQVLLLVTIPDCARRLHEARGTEARAAKWAVETWAHALGLLPEGGAGRDEEEDEGGDDGGSKGTKRPQPSAAARWAVIGAVALVGGYAVWHGLQPAAPVAPPSPAPVAPPSTAPVPPSSPAPVAPPTAAPAVPPPSPAPPPAASAAIDPRLVGTWRTTLTNVHGQWTFLFRPEANGAFRTQITGPAPLPDDVGVLAARDGRWTVQRPNGNNDAGTYTFLDPDTVSFTGKGGTLRYERVSAAASKSPRR
jgi:hypothetical protein